MIIDARLSSLPQTQIQVLLNFILSTVPKTAHWLCQTHPKSPLFKNVILKYASNKIKETCV